MNTNQIPPGQESEFQKFVRELRESGEGMFFDDEPDEPDPSPEDNEISEKTKNELKKLGGKIDELCQQEYEDYMERQNKPSTEDKPSSDPLKEQESKFIVECNVCGQRYENWVGSTPCCGSIAYRIDENGKKTSDFYLYGKIIK